MSDKKLGRPKIVKLKKSKNGVWYINFGIKPFKNDARSGMHYYHEAEVMKVAKAVDMELTNPRIVHAVAALGRPHKRTQLLSDETKNKEITNERKTEDRPEETREKMPNLWRDETP